VLFSVYVFILSNFGVDSVFEEDNETTPEGIIKSFVGIVVGIFVFMKLYSICSNYEEFAQFAIGIMAGLSTGTVVKDVISVMFKITSFIF
jgi:hypothetical protein